MRVAVIGTGLIGHLDRDGRGARGVPRRPGGTSIAAVAGARGRGGVRPARRRLEDAVARCRHRGGLRRRSRAIAATVAAGARGRARRRRHRRRQRQGAASSPRWRGLAASDSPRRFVARPPDGWQRAIRSRPRVGVRGRRHRLGGDARRRRGSARRSRRLEALGRADRRPARADGRPRATTGWSRSSATSRRSPRRR